MAEEKKMSAAPAKAVTAVKKDDTKPGFFKRAAKWFREMKSELKKVIWPTGKQLFNNTVVSVVVMLVSALAGREHVLNAYEEAIKERYRFFSFGDACFFTDDEI